MLGVYWHLYKKINKRAWRRESLFFNIVPDTACEWTWQGRHISVIFISPPERPHSVRIRLPELMARQRNKQRGRWLLCSSRKGPTASHDFTTHTFDECKLLSSYIVFQGQDRSCGDMKRFTVCTMHHPLDFGPGIWGDAGVSRRSGRDPRPKLYAEKGQHE